jgi:hypothetical protein
VINVAIILIELFAVLIKTAILCLTIEGENAAPRALVSAASGLQIHLSAMPEPHQSDWKTYLRWDDWGSDLADARLPRRETLEAVTHRFYGVREGLEQPALVQMRTELRRFLGGDHQQGAAPEHPALLIRANPTILTEELAKLSRSRQDQRNTGAWIAGAWVTGQAHSDAKITAKLASYGNAAAIEVRVRGRVDTPHTIARSGSFQVHGSAQSQLEGVAYLYLDHLEVRASEPQFSAQTNSSVSHVDGPKPLRGVAKRKAQKKQEQGEAEGADLIASQAKEELTRELEAEVQKANTEFAAQSKYHTLLKRADLVPNLLTTGFMPDSLQVGLRFADAAAPSLPTRKELSAETALEVSMHESLLTGFAANFVRGSTWSDVDFSRMQRELTGTNSNEMLIGASPTRWSARWDWLNPISAKITPQGIHYQLSFSQVRIDDRLLDLPLVVEAAYRPTSQRWGIEFHRVGEVELSSTISNPNLAEEDQTLLKRKFSALFGKTIYLDGLSPPAGGGWDGLAAFAISNVELVDGWMVISSRRAPHAVKSAAR